MQMIHIAASLVTDKYTDKLTTINLVHAVHVPRVNNIVLIATATASKPESS